MSFLDQNIESIKQLCEKHYVLKLFAFGSVLKNNFNEDSDVDLLVDFNDAELENYAENYFSLKRSLEKLFGKPVDLLEQEAVKNPYFLKSLNDSKHLIYG